MSDSNAKTPGQEALSLAIELMRKATEQAVNEAYPQKESEGQAGPPFPQERVLPHSRRGGEIQRIRQEQEADRLR